MPQYPSKRNCHIPRFLLPRRYCYKKKHNMQPEVLFLVDGFSDELTYTRLRSWRFKVNPFSD